MKKTYTKDQTDFIAQWFREFNETPSTEKREAMDRLFILAQRHNQAAEDDCNGAFGSESESLAVFNKIEHEIRLVAEKLNLANKINFSGDPRGFTVKVHFPSGAYNTWGGKEAGWGVPTT